MKKWLLILILFLISGILILLVSGMVSKIEKARQLSEKIRIMPDFSFQTIDGAAFNSREIRSGPALVIRFDPECEHCRYEISELMNSPIPYSGTRIIMISSANTDSVKKLLSIYDLPSKPFVTALADTSALFGNIFGSDFIPSNYIYDKKLRLVRVLFGEVKTETIQKYLKQCE